LSDRAVLEAKGSDGGSPGSLGGGGGGGGVISINTSALIGREPNVTIATAGGRGEVPGESGVVIINGKEKRQQYNPGMREAQIWHVCTICIIMILNRHHHHHHHRINTLAISIIVILFISTLLSSF